MGIIKRKVYSKFKSMVENVVNNHDEESNVNLWKSTFNNMDSLKLQANKINNLIEENELLKTDNANLNNYIQILNDRINFLNNRTQVESKIKVLFLFQIASFWPSWESIYEKMIKDDRFIVKLFLLITPGKEVVQTETAKAFLENHDITFSIFSEDELSNYHPNIIFIQTPYDNWHRNESEHSNSFLRKGYRLIYIPYGIEFSNTDESIYLQYKSPFFQNMWKIYTNSNEFAGCYYENNGNIMCQSVVATGHPKFDGLINNKCLTKYNFKSKYRNKKIFLLKLHFKRTMRDENGIIKEVTPNIKIYIDFLKKAGNYKSCIFILLTHPKFYEFLDDKELKSFNKVKNEFNNILEFRDDDYREALYSADYFISDRSAVLFEAISLKKPVLFVYNKDYKEPFTPCIDPLMDSLCKGCTSKDIENFVNEMLHNKFNNTQVMANFKKVFPLSDGHSSERILNDIKKSL